MATLMEQAALPLPEYEVIAGEVLVRFRNKGKGHPRPSKHVPMRERILAALQDQASRSVSELLELLGEEVSRRTVQVELRKLASEGVVHSTGKGPAVRWALGPPKN
jgi:DNA-binding transcriptional ArsR family regulator